MDRIDLRGRENVVTDSERERERETKECLIVSICIFQLKLTLIIIICTNGRNERTNRNE